MDIDDKTNPARLIQRASSDEKVTISSSKDSSVRPIPAARPKGQRKLGVLKGKLAVGPEFFEPLPFEEVSCW